MLLDLVAHFRAFNLKAASVTRQIVPKTSCTEEHCISFVWRKKHLVFMEQHLYHCGNNIGLLKTKKFSLNKNIYYTNFTKQSCLLECKYFSQFLWFTFWFTSVLFNDVSLLFHVFKMLISPTNTAGKS